MCAFIVTVEWWGEVLVGNGIWTVRQQYSPSHHSENVAWYLFSVWLFELWWWTYAKSKKKQERKKIGTKHSHKWMRKQKSTMNRGKSGKWNVDLSSRGKNANGKWAWKSKTIQIIIIQMCDANAGHVLDHMYRITRMMVLAGKVTKTNSLKFCKTSW